MTLIKSLSVTIAGAAFGVFGTVVNLAVSSSTLAKEIIPKTQLYAQFNPSAGASQLCEGGLNSGGSSLTYSSSSSGNFCITGTNLPSADTIAVNVDWNAVKGENTSLELGFGLNTTAGFKPENFNNSAYSSHMAYMNPGIVRFHNVSNMEDSTSPDGIIDTANRSWDANKIKSALTSSLNMFGNNQPERMMSIPTWPTWMDANKDGFLDSNQFDNYAKFCAALVKIVNIDNRFNVKYWELTNEEDAQYFTQFHAYGGWGALLDPTKPDRINEIITIYNKVAVAMKQVDPTILTGGPSTARADLQPFYKPFIKGTLDNLDFFSYHFYATGNGYTPDAEVYNVANVIADYTKSMVQALNEASPNKHIPVMLDEFNINYEWSSYDPRMTNNKGAVFDALLIVKAIESGADATMAWNEKDDIFGKTSSQDQLRLGAHLFYLMNNFLVGLRATTTTSDDNAVVPFAVISSDTRHKNVMLINRSSSSKQIKTNFNGWIPAQTSIDKYQISSFGFTNETINWNSVSNGNLVVPEHSVTLLSFPQ